MRDARTRIPSHDFVECATCRNWKPVDQLISFANNAPRPACFPLNGKISPRHTYLHIHRALSHFTSAGSSRGRRKMNHVQWMLEEMQLIAFDYSVESIIWPRGALYSQTGTLLWSRKAMERLLTPILIIRPDLFLWWDFVFRTFLRNIATFYGKCSEDGASKCLLF